VVDITIQGLVQSEDRLGHVITSYPLNAPKNRKTNAAIVHPNRYLTRLSEIAAMAACGTFRTCQSDVMKSALGLERAIC
jgi:hypothetical protein